MKSFLPKSSTARVRFTVEMSGDADVVVAQLVKTLRTFPPDDADKAMNALHVKLTDAIARERARRKQR